MINFYEWNRAFTTTKMATPTPSSKVNQKEILINGSQLRYYQHIKTKRLPPKRVIDIEHQIFRTID